MNQLLARGIDWLFPKRCMLCGRIPEPGDQRFARLGLCESCRVEDYILPRGNSREKKVPEWIRISFDYSQQIRETLAELKYEGMKDYGAYFGGWMAEEGTKSKFLKQSDLIVPVPLAASREKERGYNQTQLMAEALSRWSGVAWQPLLIRAIDTMPQKDLSEEMRRKNVEHAFRVKEGIELTKLEGRRIILIDDIYTSGATLEACRQTLLQADPKLHIAGWTLSG